MTKVFDCFPFNNELDILELRLNELNNVVDRFVICESPFTHSGLPKPLHLKDALNSSNRFDSFKDKITLLEYAANEPYSLTAWQRENTQRNTLMEILPELSEDDLILLSDCDEIPKKNFIASRKFIEREKVPFLLSKQYFHYYSFKYMKKETCHGTIAFYVGSLSGGKMFQDLRNERFNLPYIDRSGWHLSFFGSPEHVKNKIESFAHTEFGHCNDLNKIKDNIDKGIDIFNRNNINEQLIKISNNQCLPDYVLANTDKYKDWL